MLKNVIITALATLLCIIGFTYFESMEELEQLREHVAAQVANNKPTKMKRRDLFNLNGLVPEVSGAAYDRARGVIWTLSDGKRKSPRLFLGVTSMKSYETKIVTILGAENINWEAIVMDANNHVWMLDVGDNDRIRPDVQLYEMDPDKINEKNEVTVERRINVTYEEGGPRNVEAGFFFEGKLFLIEKHRHDDPKVAYIDFATLQGANAVAMNYKHIKEVRWITDATVTEQGDIYLLSYLGIYHIVHNDKHDKFEPKEFEFEDKWGQAESLFSFEDGKLVIGDEYGNFFIP